MKTSHNSVIGLVGGIACGKSTVSEYLSKNKDIYWINADNLAHDALCKYSVLKHLYNKWKKTNPNIIKKEWLDNDNLYLDSIINLTKLEKNKLISDVDEVVFDEKELRFLETLICPIVSMQIKSIVKSRDGIIILDTPLLFETGLNTLCNFIWFINLSFSKRLENFIKRYPNELSSVIQKKLIIREKNQINLGDKIRMSDVTLNNNDNMFNVLKEWLREGSWGLSF